MPCSNQLLHLLFTTILLLFCHTISASRLIGTPPGTPKYLQFGETLGVTCSPDSTDSAQELKWYGPNIYIPGNGEPNLVRSRSEMPVEPGESFSRVYSQLVGSNLKLYIVRITSQDTGLYNCTGRVDNIPAHWSFELQAFEGLTLEADPDQIVIHGEDSLIRCLVRSQPAPETEWYFDEVFIDPLVNTKYALSPDGLIVRNPEFTDSGLYECVGTETTRGTIKQEYINVEVVTRPRMLTPPLNTTGIRWRDARILCNASSIPAPNYRWYDGTPESKGKEVTTEEYGDRFRVSGTNGDLNIVDVHIEDEQWYWCEAYNKAGTVTGKAYFEVQMIPVFMDDNNLNKTETHAGATVEMICQCEAKPNARMSFKREGYEDRYINGFQQDDQRIYVYEKSSSAQQENQLIIPREVVIRINNTTPNDTANYTCIAENSAGKNETQMHIIIQHVPNFELMTETLRTQCIWEDHPRNITALLSGYPQPSVAWSRGDGRAITPGEAYKIYFEPYWENGRRDEWLANLEINWQVSKAGIQGQFNPTGNYFPVSTNNLGTAGTTISVIEASLPGRPRSVNATSKNAQSIVLAAEPPVEDNCIQVIAFEIVYRIHGTGILPRSLLFNLDEKRSMRIGDLESGASYMFEVYARNERGRGRFSNSLIVDTLASTAPEVVEVTSLYTAYKYNQHQVVWDIPEDGGESIIEYVISWRKKGEESWQQGETSTSHRSYNIKDLSAATEYELKVQARNRRGLSADPSPLYNFRTPSQTGSGEGGGNSGLTAAPSVSDSALEIHFIIIIAVVALLMLLVALDMICYCSRDCGILACICGGVSTKHRHEGVDMISLDGGESRSLTSDTGPANKSSFTAANRSLSIGSTVPFGGSSNTHGQDNRMYDSQPSMGRAGDTFKPPIDEKEKSGPHEYINTANLNPATNSTYERNKSRSIGRPVPQPRVPSRPNSVVSRPSEKQPVYESEEDNPAPPTDQTYQPQYTTRAQNGDPNRAVPTYGDRVQPAQPAYGDRAQPAHGQVQPAQPAYGQRSQPVQYGDRSQPVQYGAQPAYGDRYGGDRYGNGRQDSRPTNYTPQTAHIRPYNNSRYNQPQQQQPLNRYESGNGEYDRSSPAPGSRPTMI